MERDICRNGEEENEEKEILNLQLLVELNSNFEEEASYWRRGGGGGAGRPSLVHQMLRVADFPTYTLYAL